MKPITINDIECVTMRNAADLIGCSYSLVAWLIERGRINVIVPGGREKFVPMSEIERTIAERKEKSLSS